MYYKYKKLKCQILPKKYQKFFLENDIYIKKELTYESLGPYMSQDYQTHLLNN